MSNPKINTEFIFTMPLFKNGAIVVNPTLAAGDITVHGDGVDFGNIDTISAVTPASQESVKVTVSAAEMNNAYIGIVFIDQTSPKAWDDAYISIETSANTVDEIKAETALILTDTVEIGTAGIGLTNLGASGNDWNTVVPPTEAQMNARTLVSSGYASPTNITAGTIATVTNGVSLANGAVTDASLAGGLEIVFETDFATNYNTTRNAWATNAQDFVGTTASDPFNAKVVAASVAGAVGSVTAGVTLANGAVTDASLAGNMEIVYETDFGTNYNVTRNAWETNVQDFVGTTAADPFNAKVVAASVAGAVGSVSGAVGSVIGGLNTAGTLTTLDALDTAQDAKHDANQLIIDRNADLIESQRGAHTWQGNYYYIKPETGNDGNAGTRASPRKSIDGAMDLVTTGNHDVIIILADGGAGGTVHTQAGTTTIDKDYVFIRGPGRDVVVTNSGAGVDTFTVTGNGCELSGFQIDTAGSSNGKGVQVTGADFFKAHHIWFNDTRGDAIAMDDCDNFQIICNNFQNSGASGSGHGLVVTSGNGESCNYGHIHGNRFNDVAGDAIRLVTTGTGTNNATVIDGNIIQGATGDGVDITASGSLDTQIFGNAFANITGSDVNDSGTTTVQANNEQWAKHSIATETRLAELDAANLPTDVAALQTDLDTLTDATTEPSGVPGVSETMVEKVGYLYMALRNQVTVTATKKTYFDNGGAAEWEKDLSDDTTTYTETEGNAI